MITEAAIRKLNGFYGGRVRHEAYLELAQEHFLDWLRIEGLIDNEQVVFKGGTSLRKFVFGHRGRFSVDLDFSISDRNIGEYVLDALSEGFTHEGVSFQASDRIDEAAMKTAWRASTSTLGESRLQSRLDFSTRDLLLPPTTPTERALIESVDSSTLGFSPVLMPLAALEETTAEKLARYRRIAFARDLYDLTNIVPFVRDKLDVIKDVLFFKVWGDVVDDGRGTAPFLGGTEFFHRGARDVRDVTEVGVLTAGPLDVEPMLRLVADTFSVMGDPDDDVQTVLARCQSRDRYRVQQWAAEFRNRMRAAAGHK